MQEIYQVLEVLQIKLKITPLPMEYLKSHLQDIKFTPKLLTVLPKGERLEAERSCWGVLQ